MKNQMEMIGACEAEIAELKARVSKTEEGQVALGESHLELSEQTEKYKKKTDDTIADSKLFKISYSLVFKRLRECDRRLDNHDKKFADLETQLTTIKFNQPVGRDKPQAAAADTQSQLPMQNQIP